MLLPTRTWTVRRKGKARTEEEEKGMCVPYVRAGSGYMWLNE